MNKREEAKYSSYLNIQTVLKEYDTEIQKVTILKRYRDMLDNYIQSIDNAEKNYQTVDAGVTGAKNTLAESVADELDSMCCALNVYAQETGDKKIEDLTDVTITEIDEMREQVLSQKSNQILEIVLEKKDILGDYDVPPEDVENFEKIVKQFSESLKNVKSTSDTSVVVHEEERELFDEVNKFLRKKLDKVIKRKKKQTPDFVKRYLKARTSRELGVRHETDQEEKKDQNPAAVKTSGQPAGTES